MEASELLNYKNWVVVGDVLNESKYAHKILKALQEANFNVVGVDPRDNTGKAYRELKDVPNNIDVIDLCINPMQGLKVMENALSLNIDKVLIQPGAGSRDILSLCKNKGIIAIEGCALVELSRL
ncbi:CoA-binding protein [Clostridiaceae bacterium UIB06]|uniref:CoA-binding protein n=1 Tax=Clostridium thailandense TaxID=2794346 RepID=A0A949WRP4_9CLOT|nr:CoA-binding protein [Clostridium thailandense]MBV7274250.1 CoA-binding protein [Clostridium thailandense]MCH5138180.1 CoA-binding protein [Clostridiaceae bacterium UIB06]